MISTLVGDKEKPFDERVKAHIDEVEADLTQWHKELEYAKTKGDARYERYIAFWIRTYENTLTELRKMLPSEC